MQNNHKKSSQFEQKHEILMAQQQTVGISLQNFKQKFVFNQNSGPDAFYLDINTPSPSQLIGINHKQQNTCIFLMSQIIFKTGEILKLPVSTTIVALNIAQYYYTRKSFLDYDLRQIAMGSMFLACKSQETLRRSYQVSSCFDYVFKMFEGIRHIKTLELNSYQFNTMKEKVCRTENQILFELGFEVHKLFDIPHRYIGGLLASFSRHKSCNEIAQFSWTFLNDIYRTKASIYFPGQVIASAAIFMALKKLNIELSEKPWWILMESSINQIQKILYLVEEMYEMTQNNEVDFNKVSQILQKIGKNSLNIQNVFPVPYYRKLSFQKQGNLKKLIINIENQQKQKQKYEQVDDKSDKSEERKSKKQQKKKKKKDKHRQRSRSNSKEKQKRKGKYQNDDETPKISRQEDIDNNQAERKLSQVSNNESVTVVKKQLNAKSTILDAKAMLSKISLQIKKIEVKNDINLKNQKTLTENPTSNIDSANYSKNKQEANVSDKDKSHQCESSEQEQDELLAELIAIKKKNLQRKQQKQN